MNLLIQKWFGKRNLESISQDELRRLVLLGENKERSLHRQIDEQEKAKERLFHSATTTASTDRQKRLAAERIASIERTICGLDQSVRVVANETRIARRVLELKQAKSKYRNKSILDRISATELAEIIQGEAVDHQIAEENYRVIESILDGSTESPLYQAETPQVREIFRQICEVSEKNLGMQTETAQSEATELKNGNTRA